MDETPRDYFKLQKIVLKATGISLNRDNSFWYKIYSVFSIIFVVGVYPLSEYYGMYVFFHDIDKLASLVAVGVTHILGAIKVFVLLKNKSKIQTTLENLEKGVFKPNVQRGGGKFEIKLINSCIKKTINQSIAYYSPTIVVWFFIMTRSIVTKIMYEDYKMWKTPAVPFSLFELKKSPEYELICFFQGYCLTIFASIISSIDLLIVGVMVHIKTQFEILRNSIQRMIEDAYNLALNDGLEVNLNDPSTIPNEYLQACLRKVVIYHHAIIKLAYEFEDQFNFLILTVFVANTPILCFAMYHASLYPITNEQSIQDYLFVIVIITQVFLYCYWGDELAFESQKIASACYEIDFVGTSTSFQKSLTLIMRRSQIPIRITAGKFTNLSLMTFVGILRLSYSYFMVLQTTSDS